MFNRSKVYPLNAAAIKAALKRNGFKISSCRRGRGTTKNTTYIVVDASDAVACVSYLNDIGVVGMFGKDMKVGRITKTEGDVYLEGAYMDERTYKELQESVKV